MALKNKPYPFWLGGELSISFDLYYLMGSKWMGQRCCCKIYLTSKRWANCIYIYCHSKTRQSSGSGRSRSSWRYRSSSYGFLWLQSKRARALDIFSAYKSGYRLRCLSYPHCLSSLRPRRRRNLTTTMWCATSLTTTGVVEGLGTRLVIWYLFFFLFFHYCPNVYLQLVRLSARTATVTTYISPNDTSIIHYLLVKYNYH